MYPPHTFAANPLDRGERERRDEDWIEAQAKDRQSQFLPFSELNVLLGVEPEPTLGWLPSDAIPSDGAVSAPIMLGIMDGSTRFACSIMSSRSSSCGIVKMRSRGRRVSPERVDLAGFLVAAFFMGGKD